jgi:hypothetical protein
MSVILTLRVPQGQSRWSSLLRTCVVTNTEEYKWSILMRFIVDCTLLGIMISGVLQKRNPTQLWYLLYFQGLFWITAAIMTEVPGVVCRPRFCHYCLVHRFDSFCFAAQIMPFKNINGEQIWAYLECGHLCVNSRQQMVGIWSVVLDAFVCFG